MKYTFITLAFALVLASCQKEFKHPPEDPIPNQEDESGFVFDSSHIGELVADTFGVEQIMMPVRSVPFEESDLTPQLQVDNTQRYMQYILLLDFNGERVEGTNWNNGGVINAKNSGLTKDAIDRIVRKVKERFKYFAVYVTTDEKLYDNAQINQRMRCIVTTTYEWYGAAGGVAYVGSIEWGNQTPCWVFSNLLQYDEDYVSQAITHELGHTLFLHHQSLWHWYNHKVVIDYEYHPGFENTAVIMGNLKRGVKSVWWIGRTPYKSLQYDGRTIEYLTGPRANFHKIGG